MSSDEPSIDTSDFVKKKLQESFLATDLLWNLFVAALYSYRYDSLLKPFPSMFMSDSGEKDVKGLEKCVDKFPKLRQLLDSINAGSGSQGVPQLLRWVTDTKNFLIKKLDISQFDLIQQKVKDSGVSAVKPNYIFEVVHGESASAKFEELRNGRQLLYAYHGSRLENFYSILHHGLASHMNKVSVFGEGTYLSSELSVSLHYSPIGRGWERSELGDRLSCVAVCEMIDHPSVKCQVKDGNSSSRSVASNSMCGEVPEKYYVVQRNDVVRVKYLLVYTQKSSNHSTARSWIRTWCIRHKFALMMAVYFLILIIVGLANSKSFHYQLKRLGLSRRR